jgi:hypothetical protein
MISKVYAHVYFRAHVVEVWSMKEEIKRDIHDFKYLLAGLGIGYSATAGDWTGIFAGGTIYVVLSLFEHGIFHQAIKRESN